MATCASSRRAATMMPRPMSSCSAIPTFPIIAASTAWISSTRAALAVRKTRDPRAGYCVLTLTDDSVEVEQVRLAYDVELACPRLLAAGLPEYFADYLRTGGNVPGHS